MCPASLPIATAFGTEFYIHETEIITDTQYGALIRNWRVDGSSPFKAMDLDWPPAASGIAARSTLSSRGPSSTLVEPRDELVEARR